MPPNSDFETYFAPRGARPPLEIEKEELKKNAATNEKELLIQLLSGKVGRNFLWSIRMTCIPSENYFTGNSNTYHNLGRAEPWRWLERKLKDADIDNYLLMIKEHKDD